MITPISRRSAIAGGGAFIASGLANTGTRGQSNSGFHAFKLGAAEVHVISDGTMGMPLDWVLPGRPREEIAKVFTDSGKQLGELSLQVNATLIRLGNELILIDAGAGPDFAPQRGKLADNLAKAGIKPETITKVVFTHAHPDHFWGIVDPLDGTSICPNARHYMTTAERDYWLKPGVETQVPEAVRGAAIGTQRRLKELAAKIEPLKPGAEVVPGLAALDTSGHSPGHVALILQSGGSKLLIGGDALIEPTISFARPAWRWGPDWDQDMAVAARLRTLDMLTAEKAQLLGYHLPWPGLGRVEKLSTSAPSYRFDQ